MNNNAECEFLQWGPLGTHGLLRYHLMNDAGCVSGLFVQFLKAGKPVHVNALLLCSAQDNIGLERALSALV